MSIEKYRKRLSANDVGTTGGHQGGVLIPKGAACRTVEVVVRVVPRRFTQGWNNSGELD
ncbi:MAG: EcoRII N-terminal effector-binding domain-containing protein [Paracoccaceae bacterium]|jgi:hypothetical protein|nr:EcoRII N-terminal effector-binding domain-containing protein [Paracoccaceae bacterium]